MIFTCPILQSIDDTNTYALGNTYPPTASSGADQFTHQYVVVRKNDHGPGGGPSGFEFYSQNELLRFNTIAIPDNYGINSATLQMWISGTFFFNSGMFLNIEWFPWVPPAVYATMYAETVGTTAGTVADTTMAAWTPNTLQSISLNNANNNINRSDYTGMRLSISALTPTGVNEVYFYSFDDVNFPPPQLVIDASPGYLAHSLGRMGG